MLVFSLRPFRVWAWRTKKREYEGQTYVWMYVYKGLRSQKLLIHSPWSVALLTGFWVDDTLRCTIWGGEGPLLLVRSFPGRGFSDKLTPSSSCESGFSNMCECKKMWAVKYECVYVCGYLWIPIVKQQVGCHDFIVFLFDERFLYFLLTETHLKHYV